MGAQALWQLVIYQTEELEVICQLWFKFLAWLAYAQYLSLTLSLSCIHTLSHEQEKTLWRRGIGGNIDKGSLEERSFKKTEKH